MDTTAVMTNELRAASVPSISRRFGASNPSQAAATAGKTRRNDGASVFGSTAREVSRPIRSTRQKQATAATAARKVEPGGRSKNLNRMVGGSSFVRGSGKNRV